MFIYFFKLLNVACLNNVVNMTFSYSIIVYCVKNLSVLILYEPLNTVLVKGIKTEGQMDNPAENLPSWLSKIFAV